MQEIILYSFLAFLFSLVVTYVTIPAVISLSIKHKRGAIEDERSSHKGIIPNLGGIAISCGLILSLLLVAELDSLRILSLSYFLILILGIFDDLRPISAFKKLIAQIIVSLVIILFADIRIDNFQGVLGIHELPQSVSVIFSVFVYIVITNAYNLIDGIDGLASGIGIIAAVSFGILAVYMHQYNMSVIAFALSGSLLAFLKYNFYPAKIFMGDTGSLCIGMIFSVLSMNIIKNGCEIDFVDFKDKGPLIAIAFLAIPLFDSLRVFVIRLSKGSHPLHAGRDHIHHLLLDLNFGHKKSSFYLYSAAIFLIIVCYFLIDLNINYAIAILSAVSFLVLAIPFYFLKKK